LSLLHIPTRFTTTHINFRLVRLRGCKTGLPAYPRLFCTHNLLPASNLKLNCIHDIIDFDVWTVFPFTLIRDLSSSFREPGKTGIVMDQLAGFNAVQKERRAVFSQCAIITSHATQRPVPWAFAFICAPPRLLTVVAVESQRGKLPPRLIVLFGSVIMRDQQPMGLP